MKPNESVLASLDLNVNGASISGTRGKKELKTNGKNGAKKNNVKRVKRSVVVSSDDEEINKKKRKKRRASFNVSSDEEYLSPLDCSDDENDGSITLSEAIRRKSLNEKLNSKKKHVGSASKDDNKKKRRRRSSARFLRLSGRFENESDDVGEDEPKTAEDQEKLSEMYRQAIRLNAENKINAGNSWGLNLIENMDKFLANDEDPSSSNKNQKGVISRGRRSMSEADWKNRVNFTKASCTLDASVKIYSYRVDDIHLTSYKVLANLNRSDVGKEKENDSEIETEGASKKQSAVGDRSQSEKRGVAETLETNIASLNMSKLDSAYDIDPLFHKMSKNFDEGGAKGLLLVNLGIATNRCAVVFDSKDEVIADKTSNGIEAEKSETNDSVTDIDIDQENELCEVNISSLCAKMDSLLDGSEVSEKALVPQLVTLREEYNNLSTEGYVDSYVDTETQIVETMRYVKSAREEEEAEKSIYREALERSSVSLENNTFVGNDTTTLSAHAGGDDYVGNFGDCDDDGDDNGIDGFVAMDISGEKYSSMSFNTSADGIILNAEESKTPARKILDMICDGDAIAGGGDYGYFTPSALEKLTSGNVWAGAAHWKKNDTLRKKSQKKAVRSETKTKVKKKTTDCSFVDLRVVTSPSIFDKAGSKSKNKKSTSIELSQSARQRWTKNDNLLPYDASVGVEQLSRLFLRPKTDIMKRTRRQNVNERKSRVSFGPLIESCDIIDDGIDDSLDDGGAGYNFGGEEDNFDVEDNFVVHDLEGIRKVNKIEVGYAKVAKKVDVKRLKQELWAEIEARTARAQAQACETDVAFPEAISNNDVVESLEDKVESLTFGEAISHLEAHQGQEDASLPFFFICLLHLANEKGLKLESAEYGLSNFIITRDDGSAPNFGTMPSRDSLETMTKRKRVK
mmetsp:Transcript_4486/g.4967  ORF Transcript_4486/g.4967 Transcript_4486/m.4967 type:complete len:912 (+) Transcript_4486:148-2883(+)